VTEFEKDETDQLVFLLMAVCPFPHITATAASPETQLKIKTWRNYP